MVAQIGDLARSHKADAIVVGSLIFTLKWLRTLHLPLIHARLAPYDAAGDRSAVEAHACDVVHWLSIQRSYGFANAAKAEAAIPDEDLITAVRDMREERSSRHVTPYLTPHIPHIQVRDMREELTLLAYAPSCEASPGAMPGLPMARTGFWLSPAPPSWTAPAELAAFVDVSSGAAPPICLNFGSMAVYERAAWAPALLDGLRSLVASGRHRVVAVGDHVPESVRGWPSTLWVRSVPHAYLFPKCGCVIHHGGSGTSAAAAAAGVPSVVVPFLGWSDQPRFAAWLARAAAGVAVTDPASLDAAGWAAAVERAATDASLKAGAVALGRLMASEGGGGAAGAAAAVAAIDAHFGAEKIEKAPKGGALVAAAAASTAAASQLEALKSLKLSDGGKLRAGLYCLFREPSALPLQTYQARDTWLKTLGKQLVEFPLYKADWPPKHRPLDLALHDLPHASSLIEWWYYHAHLTAADGTPFCVFGALFQLKLGGETLSHVHASLLIEGKRHVYYSAGEPHAAAAAERTNAA